MLSPPDTMRRLSVHYASDNRLFVTASPSARPDGDAAQRSDIYTLSPTGTLELLITPGQTAIPAIPVQRALSGGRLLVAFGRGFGIVNPADKTIRSFAATSYSASATGEDVVFVTTRRVEQPAPVVPFPPIGTAGIATVNRPEFDPGRQRVRPIATEGGVRHAAAGG